MAFPLADRFQSQLVNQGGVATLQNLWLSKCMIQEKAFTFLMLFVQAAIVGGGGFGIAAVIFSVGHSNNQRSIRLIVFPLLWSGLILVAALFARSDSKNGVASWSPHLIGPFLLIYLVVWIWTFVTLPKAQGLTALCALTNLPALFIGWLFVSMAASNSWF